MRKLGIAILTVIGLSLSVVYGRYLYLIENDVTSPKWVASYSGLNLTDQGWALESFGGGPPEYVNFTEDYSNYNLNPATIDGYFVNWTDLDRMNKGTIWDQRSELGSIYQAHFNLNLEQLEAEGKSRNLCWVFMVCEIPPDDNNYAFRQTKDNGYEFYGIVLYGPLSQNSVFYYQVTEAMDGDTYSSDPSVNLNVGREYYFSVYKDGTNFTVSVFDDEDRTNKLDQLSITLHNDWNFNYSWVLTAIGAYTDPRVSSGHIGYLTFDSPGGYLTNGVLYTKDLLENTTSPAWVHLCNASLPKATRVLVRFSPDNNTWTDPISIINELNRTAIFLGDLNYTSLYVQYQLTGDGSETPILNYMGLSYPVEEPGDGNGGTCEASYWPYLLAPVALLIGYAWKEFKT